MHEDLQEAGITVRFRGAKQDRGFSKLPWTPRADTVVFTKAQVSRAGL